MKSDKYATVSVNDTGLCDNCVSSAIGVAGGAINGCTFPHLEHAVMIIASPSGGLHMANSVDDPIASIEVLKRALYYLEKMQEPERHLQ